MRRFRVLSRLEPLVLKGGKHETASALAASHTMPLASVASCGRICEQKRDCPVAYLTMR